MVEEERHVARREHPILQLAIDLTSAADALRIVERIYPAFDILEIGTPLILNEGFSIVGKIKQRFPGKRYLADIKIADSGYLEAAGAFRSGADIVTVLGVADDRTVRGVLDAAGEYGGEVMVDMLGVADLFVRAKQVEAMGVSMICLHTAHDLKGTGVDPMADLRALRDVVTRLVAIAGGLKPDDVGRAITLGADVIVIGGGIIADHDPRKAAEAILQMMRAPS